MGDMCALDKDKTLSELVRQVFPCPIRLLLDNQYVFQAFGDEQSNTRSDGSIPGHWREAFDDARQHVHRALSQQDTERVLYEVFVRPYTLRNRVGARWHPAGEAIDAEFKMIDLT